MDASPSGAPLKSSATLLEKLDTLYNSLRGSPYGTAVTEAKKSFQAKDYAETLRLVRGTAELHRRAHLKTLQQEPEKIGKNKEEFQKIRAKQAKIQNALTLFSEVAQQLEKLARSQPEKPQAPLPAKPSPIPEPFPAPIAKESEADDDFIVAIINKGTFTQLQMAAQTTGLLPNADAIGFIRDHEFRTKKYQEAFDRIEGLFVHLRTAAEQRMQRLRQEEMSYRSGTFKMSPKEWLTKQQRDTAKTQNIVRTLRYFTKVLDGLRLLQTSPEAAPRDESLNDG